ncbi:hypothetical protein HHI36_014740 [Cryptolaemus montrouzieri]|uniref:Uncharacterized protein n=1 Tax=Cryptolaemus montrouzieri TaxID=559131 RepID=A0ABD2N3L3_9CUCU
MNEMKLNSPIISHMYLGGFHVQQMVSTATADNLVLNGILQKHENIFADGKFDIGTIRNYEASIKLTENRFVAKRPYRCSLQDRDEIDSQVSAGYFSENFE